MEKKFKNLMHMIMLKKLLQINNSQKINGWINFQKRKNGKKS